MGEREESIERGLLLTGNPEADRSEIPWEHGPGRPPHSGANRKWIGIGHAHFRSVENFRIFRPPRHLSPGNVTSSTFRRVGAHRQVSGFEPPGRGTSGGGLKEGRNF